MRRLTPLAAVLALFTTPPALAETLAITGGRLITAGPQGTLETGVIVIRDGKIVSVGRAAPPPEDIQLLREIRDSLKHKA